MKNDNIATHKFDLGEVIKPYVRKWYWFVLSALLLLALGYLFIKMSPPVYKAITTVLIKDAKKMSSASGDFSVLQNLGGFGGMGTNSIENEIEIFKSKTIVEDVLRSHHFQTPIYEKGLLKDTELYGRTSPYIIRVIAEKLEADLPKKPIDITVKNGALLLSSEEWSKDITGRFNGTIALPFANIMIEKNRYYWPPKKGKTGDVMFVYKSFEDAVNDFQESLTVDLLDKDATVISISVNFENKEKAKDFLNSIVRQYNIYAIGDKNLENRKTKEFIDDRITLISQELGDVELEKQQYKTDNNIVDLATEARLNLQQREATRAEIIQLETQSQIVGILQNSLHGKSISDILPLNIGLDNDAAAELISNYNALVLQRNKVLESATPENPLAKDLEQQIRDIKSTLNESLQKNAQTIQLARNQAEAQFGFNSGNIDRIPVQERLFRNIERQQQIKENLYLLLLEKREEAAISMEMTSEKARVVDRAFVRKKPVAPRKMIIMGISLLTGLLLPFGFIYLREALNKKIVGRRDITDLTDIPIIGEIPRMKTAASSIIQPNDVSPIAEAFRILMTNLKYLLASGPSAKKVMVTSSVKGEGKTFISVNLALVMASGGSKVLVIGSDIRNPQLQRYKPEMKNADGLTEFLHGTVTDVDQIIHPSGFHPNCDFIYSGKIPPNPADLLMNGRYSELLESVENRYDYVLMDTAPLMLVTDSFLISDLADATVYIVRSEYSEEDFITFVENAADSKKIHNASIAINDISRQNFGYGNTYGYGYHATEKKWWHFFKRDS